MARAARTSSLNCLSYRDPYQTELPPPFPRKPLFFTERCFVASPSQKEALIVAMVSQNSFVLVLHRISQQKKGLPLPLGRGVCETKSKNGRSRPRKPFISRVFCAQGLRPWSQTMVFRKRQFVHKKFCSQFLCSLTPPPPNQQNEGFPLEFLLEGPQTELRTLSQNCEQTSQKLRTKRIMNKRAFLSLGRG